MMCVIDWAAVGTWVGAIATVVLAIFTFKTLRYVKKDTQTTRGMSRTAQVQLRRSLAPFLVLVDEPRKPDNLAFKAWYVRNIGTGPAYDIQLKGHMLVSEANPVAANDRGFLVNIDNIQDPLRQDFITIAHRTGDVVITYKGLNEDEYETTVLLNGAVRFRELNPIPEIPD